MISDSPGSVPFPIRNLISSSQVFRKEVRYQATSKNYRCKDSGTGNNGVGGNSENFVAFEPEGVDGDGSVGAGDAGAVAFTGRTRTTSGVLVIADPVRGCVTAGSRSGNVELLLDGSFNSGPDSGSFGTFIAGVGFKAGTLDPPPFKMGRSGLTGNAGACMRILSRFASEFVN